MYSNTNGALLANLFIYYNMSAEMIYVIEQRLLSQNIPSDKAAVVMTCITNAVFSAQMLKSFSSPEITYDAEEYKALFLKHVNSSLMKIYDKSYKKLFDLMVMVFKLQVQMVSDPPELFALTLRHLENIAKIQSQPSVASTLAFVNQHCSTLSHSQYRDLRTQLLNFLAQFNCKVLSLLERKYQNENGFFQICLRPIPEYYPQMGSHWTPRSKQGLLAGFEPYAHRCTQVYSKHYRYWSTDLGQNIYKGDLPKFYSKSESAVAKGGKTTEQVQQRPASQKFTLDFEEIDFQDPRSGLFKEVELKTPVFQNKLVLQGQNQEEENILDMLQKLGQ